MRIKLSTLQGPAGLEWYSFTRYPVRIGRKYDNEVAITDSSVSRYHCEITLRGDELWVLDLGSVNGIAVNGERAIERKVEDGDELAVGLVKFQINTSEERTEANSDGAPPVKLSRMNTVVLDPAGSSWAPRMAPNDSRAESDLVVLLEVCRALQARLPLHEITERLLQLLKQALPFAAGSVMLVDPTDGRLLETTKMPADHAVDFDCSVALRGGADFTDQALAVPLMVSRTILGAVCVRPDGSTPLDRQHLHLAAAMSAMAAAAIDNARREQRLGMRVSLLEQERSWAADLAGESPEAQSIRRHIEDIAASAAPALIVGPPGIGKDGVGRAIHAASAFSQGPFVLARVLGRDQETLERLMFGVASSNGVELGWFDQAEGGTLFLDRIEGLGAELQQRFYATLETGEFARKGGSTAPARCRILASAAESAESAVARGDFDSELYLRLRGLTIRMPGLRERPADIRQKAEILATAFSETAGRSFDGFSEDALVALTLYEWPDNVRELESVIRSAEMRRTGRSIEVEDLPDEVAETLKPGSPGGYHHEVREARRQIILTAMEKARGSYSMAADLLRINRTYLHRLIRNLGLRDEIVSRFGR